MGRLEVLHHIPRLQCTSLRDGSGREVGDCVAGRHCGEHELQHLGHSADGVEVRLSQRTNCQNRHGYAQEDGEERLVQGQSAERKDELVPGRLLQVLES